MIHFGLEGWPFITPLFSSLFLPFKVSKFSTSHMGDPEIPRDATNYGDIPLGLYYNHFVVIHVDTEIYFKLCRWS